MSFPEMIRNVAVVGHLHHGKTALVDMLVFETHKLDWNSDTQARLLSYYFALLRYQRVLWYRRATPTLMCFHGKGRFRSSHPPFRSSSGQQPGNPI